jgi:hypothetical protein
MKRFMNDKELESLLKLYGKDYVSAKFSLQLKEQLLKKSSTIFVRYWGFKWIGPAIIIMLVLFNLWIFLEEATLLFHAGFYLIITLFVGYWAVLSLFDRLRLII